MQSIRQQPFISNSRYVVRFASCDEDIKKAQRLRYQVFNVELGEGLACSSASQLDADRFDSQCHHLLVIHRDDNEVIGTYRMQTYETARKSCGFYTEKEFDLSNFPCDILHHSLEVGRACIEMNHRNSRVLFLLWKGIAKYLQFMNCRYLLGCCSLTSQQATEGWGVMHYIKDHGMLHDRLRASITTDYQCEEVAISKEEHYPKTLPKLFQLYMDLGAKVCSRPAIDKAFKTIDFLVLLDVDQLDEDKRALFFS